jgi:hypothetical protein
VRKVRKVWKVWKVRKLWKVRKEEFSASESGVERETRYSELTKNAGVTPRRWIIHE